MKMYALISSLDPFDAANHSALGRLKMASGDPTTAAREFRAAIAAGSLDEAAAHVDLAESYVALIEQLDLRDVTVIGNSIGGWIAAEMALLDSTRISRFILADATGIVVEGQPVTDIFQISLDQLAQLSYHNPTAFRIDPSAMTDAQKAGMAANRQTLAVYGGSMTDPTLLKRLSAVKTPTLVLWGDSDGIVTPTYGQAYAAAIPTAAFQLLPNTGHLPHLETPDQTLSAIWSFVGAPLAHR